MLINLTYIFPFMLYALSFFTTLPAFGGMWVPTTLVIAATTAGAISVAVGAFMAARGYFGLNPEPEPEDEKRPFGSLTKSSLMWFAGAAVAVVLGGILLFSGDLPNSIPPAAGAVTDGFTSHAPVVSKEMAASQSVSALTVPVALSAAAVGLAAVSVVPPEVVPEAVPLIIDPLIAVRENIVTYFDSYKALDGVVAGQTNPMLADYHLMKLYEQKKLSAAFLKMRLDAPSNWAYAYNIIVEMIKQKALSGATTAYVLPTEAQLMGILELELFTFSYLDTPFIKLAQLVSVRETMDLTQAAAEMQAYMLNDAE